MTTNDWDQLAALAQAATPGPWTLIGGGEYITPVGILVAPDDGGVSSEDAEFIAAANPATILNLIAERDALAAKVAAVEAIANDSSLHIFIQQKRAGYSVTHYGAPLVQVTTLRAALDGSTR